MRIVIDTDEIKTKAKRLVSLLRRGCLRWDEDRDLDVLRGYRAEQEALLERAAMNEYNLNTGVIRPTVQGEPRVMVSSSMDRDWGDTICLSTMSENEPGMWKPSHFSPARARLIALHLITRAEELERREPSSKTIDRDEDAKLEAA